MDKDIVVEQRHRIAAANSYLTVHKQAVLDGRYDDGLTKEFARFEASLRPPSTDATVEGEALARNAEQMATIFDYAEIWTPDADTTRMSGPAVAKCIRTLVAALQLRSPRADAAEETPESLLTQAELVEHYAEIAAATEAENTTLKMSNGILDRALTAAVAERDKLREILSLALEYPASSSTIWGNQARKALASITDEKSAESGRDGE